MRWETILVIMNIIKVREAILSCTLSIINSVLYYLWRCSLTCSHLEENLRLGLTHWISTGLFVFIRIFPPVRMNTTATISNDSDGLGEQRLMEESDPMTDEQRSEVQRWSYCCRLISKEAEHAISNLHFAHVLRSQFTNGNRWPLLCHLRSIELHHKKNRFSVSIPCMDA